ncbi:MAG: T9SS type A sorting domain-containing protein [Ignavibacteria bacterium]|nr:T9SS type A sorting domain-containing protein [Ignavibacteria bacterium]
MKISFIFFLFVFLSLSSLYSQLQLEWERRYNNPINGEDDAFSIDIDNVGNSYVTGRSYNGNNYDITTIKYDNSGNLIWSKNYSGNTNLDDYPVKIMCDKYGNAVVSGISNYSNLFELILLKYSNSGVQLWAKRFFGIPGRSFSDISMAMDTSSNTYILGKSNEVGNGCFLIVKFASNGDTLWTRRFIDTSQTYANPQKLILDSLGNLYVTGTNNSLFVIIKYDSSGQMIWVTRKSNRVPNDMCIDQAGNIIVTGDTYRSGSTDFWTAKYSKVGNFIWEKFFNIMNETAYSVNVDGSGNSYVTGYSYYYGDLVTIKYDSSGSQKWSNSIMGNFNGSNIKTLLDKDNNTLVMANYFVNWVRRVIILKKYTEAGDSLFYYQYQSPSNMEDAAYDMKLGNNNEIYITGKSMASISHFDYITLKFSQPIGIDPVSSEIPSQFSLSQNYPNPFNPATKIKFAIPAGYASQTILSVYDILGRQVAVLVNEQLKPGTYEVDWYASVYPSGVYFYKINLGSFFEIKRMVLLK